MDFDGGFDYGIEIGQYQELKLASVYRGEQYGISAVSFDLYEDLLWAASFGVGQIVKYIHLQV